MGRKSFKGRKVPDAAWRDVVEIEATFGAVDIWVRNGYYRDRAAGEFDPATARKIAAAILAAADEAEATK